jgi:hypothetical protein
MLKGGTLIYAIAISLIISMLTGFLLLSNHFQSVVFEHDLLEKKAIRNLQSGFALLLADPEIIPENEKTPYDLYENGQDSLILERKNWGAFCLIGASVTTKKELFKQYALTGNDLIADTNLALYLANNDRPLSVCGKTIIRGNCMLPKKEVKQAFIEGEVFSGDKPVYGNINILGQMQKLLDAKIGTDSLLPYSEFNDKDTISNSFTNTTLVIDCSSEKSIENKFIKGNVVLYSSRELAMASSNKIEDIIIVAKTITFQKEFTGSVQALSTDSILIEEACNFTYPSSLCISKTAKSKSSPSITIGEKTKFNGFILAFTEIVQAGNPVSVVINKDAEIMGIVYSNGILDLKGAVYGTVWCQKIILKTNSGVYENHLLNATIDRSKLSKYFVGINLFKTATSNKIAKWLN